MLPGIDQQDLCGFQISEYLQELSMQAASDNFHGINGQSFGEGVMPLLRSRSTSCSEDALSMLLMMWTAETIKSSDGVTSTYLTALLSHLDTDCYHPIADCGCGHRIRWVKYSECEFNNAREIEIVIVSY